jgi:transcriptional regulator with PAS, ATPase and Fis domain
MPESLIAGCVLPDNTDLVLEALPCGIGIIDEQGCIIYANSAYARITNQPRSQINGQNIARTLSGDISIRELYAGQRTFHYNCLTPTGTIVSADIVPLELGGGFGRAVLLVADDQELRAVKEQLQWATAKVEHLEQKLKKVIESGWHVGRMRIESPEDKLIRSLKPGRAFERIIGMSPRILELLAVADKAAKVQSTVLLTGKSGTGKELVAEGIHQASSRAQGPFVRINCAAIPETLLESELFGHERGAFTGAVKRKTGKFEQADQGTLFLDEIGEMTPSMQTKLLRVVQNGCLERIGGEETIRVDVRIIAATNRDIEKMVQAGQFREDLYYRLNVIPLTLPPLKDRKEDIPLLVNHFLKKFSLAFGKPVQGIKKTAMDALVCYDWPGNVRELQNIMERMVALTDGTCLELEDVPAGCHSRETSPHANEPDSLYGAIIQGELFSLAEYEKHIIRAALAKHGSYTAAGKALGITHKTVAAKAQKYGIDK